MTDGTPVPGGRVSDYDYPLPPELIAAYPTEERDESRLLVLDGAGGVDHGRFRDIPEWIRPGDVLVLNDSRVIPARLLGRKPTGAEVEILLVRQDVNRPAVWEAMVRPGNKVKAGATILVGDGLEVEVLRVLPSGTRRVRLIAPEGVDAALERHGHMPLPPYIDRADEELDRERYQTVYARHAGSVAAPTAGLHFTEGLLADLAQRGVHIARVTLHVGIGTFRPIDTEDPADHEMHSEWIEITPRAAHTIERARSQGGRVWAVGTTAARTLESAGWSDGSVRPMAGETRLFIYPPFELKVVDGLITNFHLPRSTLLMLVSALGGYERVMAAYAVAVEERYRFYSYGDAMLICPTRR